MTRPTWKQKLADRMPDTLARDIDVFETQMLLVKERKLDERVFMETRLRRGAYGQRYDNGQRYDGAKTATLQFPSGDLTKGPLTLWDAPGMQRIKIPFGALTAEQLEVIAECAEEYSDAILHMTTRQDVQLHFVHIEDTPDMHRRLAAVHITTQEACGNSVRNVTACAYAGVCRGETFDVSPYAKAIAHFLMGHPDTMEFGRKFKIAFSGCKTEPCGLTAFHDIGAIAVVRDVDGVPTRGFEFYVGGGLGAVPQEAKLLSDFVPETELLPLSQAVCRVFGRLGEKKNRQRARLKFLVGKLGIDEFRRLVMEERAILRPDPRWTEFLAEISPQDRPLKAPSKLGDGPFSPAFAKWRRTNVRLQRQEGYAVATISLPLGDITSDQARRIAEIARAYCGDTIRVTVEQNLVLRWVSEADLPALHAELEAIGLGEAGAGTITDVTSCPGTDTCKLGISSSRGLSGELRKRLTVVQDELDPAVKELRIKASGCFNSCGQHHVADLGFLGVSRNVKGRRVPHFQIVLGGQLANNGSSFGLAIGAIPSKNVPAAVQRLTSRFVADRKEGETFQAWIQRIGKAQIRTLLGELTETPAYDVDRSYYSDWGDPREYTIGDMGVGECAGEVVPQIEMALAASERAVFEGQLHLESGDAPRAARSAFEAMILAAQGLLRHVEVQVTDDADDVVASFRQHFYETQLFHDPFVGGKFAHYFFKAYAERAEQERIDDERAHHAIEEAQLFIEGAHGCYERLTRQRLAPAAE